MATERPMVSTYERNEEGVEELVYRPMNDDEFAQYELDQEEHANSERARTTLAKTDEIRSALAASDVYVLRAYEDGVELHADWKTYRASLRTLLGSVAQADDPSSVILPDQPSPPDSIGTVPLPNAARVAEAAAATVDVSAQALAPATTAKARAAVVEQARQAAEAKLV